LFSARSTNNNSYPNYNGANCPPELKGGEYLQIARMKKLEII
jgi:hypothetical protein